MVQTRRLKTCTRRKNENGNLEAGTDAGPGVREDEPLHTSDHRIENPSLAAF